MRRLEACSDQLTFAAPEPWQELFPSGGRDVLREQGDWFEDEIKFVRVLLAPGQQVLDIGANYGVYTLSMAKAVGPSGRVWAYEPATTTADVLAAGIAENKFEHVVLERCALSHNSGTGRLNLGEDAELNSLSSNDTPDGSPSLMPSEAVRLTTLDEQAALHHWAAIDFIKMDAEGEELNHLWRRVESLERTCAMPDPTPLWTCC